MAEKTLANQVTREHEPSLQPDTLEPQIEPDVLPVEYALPPHLLPRIGGVAREQTLLNLQSAIGNQAVQRTINRSRSTESDDDLARRIQAATRTRLQTGLSAAFSSIQPKLTVGAAHDAYEQEADQVAEQVMRMPAPVSAPLVEAETGGNAVRRAPEEDDEIQAKPLAATITPLVQRAVQPHPPAPSPEIKKMISGEGERPPLLSNRQQQSIGEGSGVRQEEDELQTKRTSAADSFEMGSDFENRLSATRSGGSPLPDEVRTFMEPRFGVNFSGVRLHSGGEAAELNRSVSAQAFTLGRDIYLGEGKTDVTSDGGKRLLAHELTHVVQQTGASNLRRKVSAPETQSPAEPARDAAIQRQDAPEEEEEIQAKADPGAAIQREASPEEEEPLQTKLDPDAAIQRQDAPEEEEEIQAKADPGAAIQREASPEEEEPLQTKLDPSAVIQRQDAPKEEEEIQAKADPGAAIQREAPPEEEEPLQTKLDPNAAIQRQDAPEEEEEIQAKVDPDAAIQREASPEEEEPLQTKLDPDAAIQRQDAPEEEDELQTKRTSAADSFEMGSDFENRLSAARSSGSSLPDEVRTFMEPRFGADFSGVRLHSGGEAAELNRSASAQAFTLGNDIYLGEGKTDVTSDSGKRLLAHELTHVVQQGGTPTQVEASADIQRQPTPDTAEVVQRQQSKPPSAATVPFLPKNEQEKVEPTAEDWDRRVAQEIKGTLESFSITVIVKWTEKNQPKSESVPVRPPYFINRGKVRLQKARTNRRLARGETNKLITKIDRERMHALIGKSTPEDIRIILQSALDKGLVQARAGQTHPDSMDLRKWLVKYGIGIDCSGLVSQALNRAMSAMSEASGETGTQEQLNIRGTSAKYLKGPLKEGKKKEGSRFFKEVSSPADLHPGDTMYKTGHIRVVMHVETTDKGVQITTAESSSVEDIGPTENQWRYSDPTQFKDLKHKNATGKWEASKEKITWWRYTKLAATRPKEPVVRRKMSDASGMIQLKRATPGGPPTPQGGWNAAIRTVDGVERIPLEGLKQGRQPDPKGKHPDAGKEWTSEGENGKAIAIVPSNLKQGQPVEILLHLHGKEIGYRQRSKARGKGMDVGSVRDVAADRIEQQISASGRNMIAILPQGTTGSYFGKFNPSAYIDEVWGLLVKMKKLPPKAERGTIVLSGHSGAATPITQMLSKGNLPEKLVELVLFDAIHKGKEKQLDKVQKFLAKKMKYDLNELKKIARKDGPDAAKVTEQQKAYLAGSFRFRGIFTIMYTGQYTDLSNFIEEWIDGRKTKGLASDVIAAFHKNYKVVSAGKGASHNTIMGDNNNLQNALSAVPGGSSTNTNIHRALAESRETIGYGRLQRSPAPAAAPAVDPVEQQWEADWNDAAFKGFRGRFSGTDRPKGDPKTRYKLLCPLYQAHGIPRPLKYVAEEIVTAKFFQFSTPAHDGVKTALAVAEGLLRAKGYKEAPVTNVWAFNARTTSEDKWSNHATGKAIDMDSGTNPQLKKPEHRQVISALTGYDIERANPGAAQGLDTYEGVKAASEAFKEAYQPEGMRARIEELAGEQVEREDERDAIKLELDEVPKGRRASRADREKAKKIRARLKAKDAEIIKVAKQHKLLAAELKKYEAVDAAIDTLSGNLLGLQQDIELLEAKIEDTTGKTRASLQRALKAKHSALKQAEKKLVAKEKARNEDKLRGYARTGFLNLSKDLVWAMRQAGFNWGGKWEAKDCMHFEVP